MAKKNPKLYNLREGRHWYRSMKKGKLWCESSNLAEVRERSPGLPIEVMSIWTGNTAWETLED